MRKILIISVAILALLVVTGSTFAQNPFMSQSRPAKEAKAVKPVNPFFVKIAVMQNQLKVKLNELVREAKSTGSPAPIFSLVFIAFTYGVLHAAGPGHGKALAASYLASRGTRVRDGIMVGGFIAFLHGLSGVTVVLLLHNLLNTKIMKSVTDIETTTKQVSFSLIAIVGTALLIKSLISFYRRTGTDRTNRTELFRKKDKSPILMGLLIGMIPCPGTVVLMLFAITIGMVKLGIFLSFFLSLGMAATISVIGMIVVFGKTTAVDSLGTNSKFAEIAEHLIETIASLMIVALGVILFLSTFH